MSRPEVYLDYQASTPCDPAVVEAMLPYFLYETANPASSHRAGLRVHAAVEVAREQVADALSCSPSEVFFTSGATESNNLVIFGCEATGRKRSGLLATAVEHKSVLEPCHEVSRRGSKLAICRVRPDGQVDIGALAELLSDEVLLVSVQFANNEIGTVQPILEIGQLAHKAGAYLHVDAAQAFGKVPIDVDELEIDFVSLSGHKCYGPKGTGALYVRGGAASGRLVSTLFGGGQEQGLRPGTPNVAGIVGMGKASSLAMERIERESADTAALRDLLETLICDRVAGVSRNGAPSRRLPGSTSLTFAGADAEAIMGHAPEVLVSSSSACNAGTVEPSYVLRAIGLSSEEAYQTIRFAVGRFTTSNDVEFAADRIASAVNQVRARGALSG